MIKENIFPILTEKFKDSVNGIKETSFYNYLQRTRDLGIAYICKIYMPSDFGTVIRIVLFETELEAKNYSYLDDKIEAYKVIVSPASIEEFEYTKPFYYRMKHELPKEQHSLVDHLADKYPLLKQEIDMWSGDLEYLMYFIAMECYAYSNKECADILKFIRHPSKAEGFEFPEIVSKKFNINIKICKDIHKANYPYYYPESNRK